MPSITVQTASSLLYDPWSTERECWVCPHRPLCAHNDHEPVSAEDSDTTQSQKCVPPGCLFRIPEDDWSHLRSCKRKAWEHHLSLWARSIDQRLFP